MTKEEAVAKIAQLKEEATKLTGEAMRLADEHGLHFYWYRPGGTAYYSSQDAWAQEQGYDNIAAFEKEEGYLPESFDWKGEHGGFWMSSSDYC